MKRLHTVGAALICLTAVSALAQGVAGSNAAESRRTGPRMMEMEGRVLQWLANDPKAAEELMLKDEQVQAIKTNMFELRKEMIDLNAKMETAAVNQAELMSNEDINEDAVMKAVEETGRTRTEIAKANIRHLLAVRKILSAEQRKKMKALMSQRMEQWRENRGRRMGGQPGAPVPPPSTGQPTPPEQPVPPAPPAPGR